MLQIGPCDSTFFLRLNILSTAGSRFNRTKQNLKQQINTVISLKAQLSFNATPKPRIFAEAAFQLLQKYDLCCPVNVISQCYQSMLFAKTS